MDARHVISAVADVLQRHVQSGNRIGVALSGGVDSVVLLHVLKALAASLGFRLSAHHINHGISPNADQWTAFCADLCRSWEVPLATTRITVPPDSAKGLEGAARIERYHVLGQLDADFIALAHHQDDQAETLLLQLSRGAGVRGLSGMPEVRRQGPVAAARPMFIRPLLGVPRAAIEAYGRAHGLRWIEDETNVNTAFARNFLRRRILPELERRFPAYRKSFTNAASHCAEASELLDDLAAIDAERALRDDRLDVKSLAALSPPRAKNLLRHFLRVHGLPMPDQQRLQEMLLQLLRAKTDSQPCIVHENFELRRFRGEIHLLRPHRSRCRETALQWRGQDRIEIPDLGGCLQFERTQGAGVAVAKLLDRPISVRFRRGGERLRLSPGGRSHTLKNLLQEAAMPPWERERLPLLVSGDDLIWVPGLGVDAAFQCAPGGEGVVIDWWPSG